MKHKEDAVSTHEEGRVIIISHIRDGIPRTIDVLVPLNCTTHF